MSVAPTLILTPSQLGQVLKAARQARKLSQAALASRLGLSQSRVSHLEAHAEELSMAQLLASPTAHREAETAKAHRG